MKAYADTNFFTYLDLEETGENGADERLAALANA